MRRKVIAGNWKMNKTPLETVEFLKKFIDLIKDVEHDIILCVPYIDLLVALELTKNTNIKIGAQNVHFKDSGAYTGEVSPKMLQDIGVEYVIIGHSERRAYYNETDESVNMKIKAALEHELKPIVCVGETLEQREVGVTKEFVTTQIRNALIGIDAKQMKKIIIAYEPIWAIGTGKTASKEDANEVCHWIREELHTLYGDVADEIIIQYGGSVKASNAKELFEMSDIDGGLVGGSSLEPEEFTRIIKF
ncbi:MAG: triose-phosphate isomerase [Clostridia bacterium]|nr:triose-phosphate isomerase [Clostridia bacterium]